MPSSVTSCPPILVPVPPLGVEAGLAGGDTVAGDPLGAVPPPDGTGPVPPPALALTSGENGSRPPTRGAGGWDLRGLPLCAFSEGAGLGELVWLVCGLCAATGWDG